MSKAKKPLKYRKIKIWADDLIKMRASACYITNVADGTAWDSALSIIGTIDYILTSKKIKIPSND